MQRLEIFFLGRKSLREKLVIYLQIIQIERLLLGEHVIGNK